MLLTIKEGFLTNFQGIVMDILRVLFLTLFLVIMSAWSYGLYLFFVTKVGPPECARLACTSLPRYNVPRFLASQRGGVLL
jgi:hypothetical protein